MNSTLLELGFIEIKWYSFFIFLGIIVAFIFIKKESIKKDLKTDNLIDILFYGIIIGIIGARLYYVLFNLNYYLTNPKEIIEIWNGGLAIHGGVIATLIFLIIYTKKKKINLFLLLDILVVGVIIAQSIGRWGNFFNSEAYGGITTLAHLHSQGIPQFVINGMYIDGAFRQPTFFYESIWCLFGFVALLLIRRYKGLKIGQLTGTYFIWYGLGRFLIENMRSDSLMLGNIKVAQLISLLFIIIGVSLFLYHLLKKNDGNDLYHSNSYIEKNEPMVYFK
jgi:phosphatidylglycerol:prolipoprotein diacylglycerol transferase